MIITSTIILLCTLSFFVPRNKLYFFFVISAVILSALYLWFNPPIDYDLYRHYLTFESMKNVSFQDLFDNQYIFDNNLLNEYSKVSKVYIIILFVMSRIGIKQILPWIVGVIIYTVASKMIWQTGSDLNSNKTAILFAFFFLYCCLDFRSVSGIRNMLAFILFSFVLYQELIQKKNKILCWILYLLICGIHMSCVIFVGLRMVLLIGKRWIKIPVMFICLFLYSFSEIIADFLTKFSEIPYLNALRLQIEGYLIGRSEYNPKGIFIYLIIEVGVIFLYLEVYKNKRFKKYVGQYGEYCLYVVIFALGSIRNYDLFVRSNIIIISLFLPIIVFYFTYIIELKGGCIRGISKRNDFKFNIVIVFSFLLVILFEFYCRIRLNYIVMDPYFG